jgi:hypothetical protein
MIKETKITKEVIVSEKHRYCDDCEKELHWSLACSAAHCQYCNKDLCEECIGYEEETDGDYRMVYCKNCWELGNEYRPKIEQYEIEIHKLYTEWQDKCKK